MVRKRWPLWRIGFTLVELLVVIAIIGILIALLLPAVQAAREAARRSQCSNNLKQLGIALHNYHDAYQRFPMGNWTWNMTVPNNPNTNSGHIRRGNPIVSLLPYLEAKTVYDQFDLKSPTFFESQLTPNGLLISRSVIPGLICPSDPRGVEGGRFAFNYAPSIGPTASRYPTVIQLGYQAPSPYSSATINGWAAWAPTPNNINGNYFGDGGRPDGWADWYNPTGSDIAGPFAKCDWAARFGDIVDGTSNVIAMYEMRPLCSWRSGEVTDWNCWDGNYYHTTTPINFPVCTSYYYNFEGQIEPIAAGWLPRNQEHVNNSIIGGGIKSKHSGGAQVLLVDGSVRFLPETMDYDTLQRLGSRSDGKPVQLP